MSNSNVGRTSTNDAGLILQTKNPVIDGNEYGLLASTLLFHLRNEQYPALDPARTTLLSAFTAGDDRTTDVLGDLTYLGKQTSRFTRNGWKPGIGLLEVHAQGAIFETAAIAQAVTSVPILTQGADYKTKPAINFFGGNPYVAATATTWLEVVYTSLASGGSGYANGEILDILGGGYQRHAEIQVTSIGGGGDIVTFIFTDRGRYSNLPTGGVFYFGRNGVVSGGSFIGSLRLNEIVITNGGAYVGTPTAALNGGGFSTEATIDDPVMGPSSETFGGTTNPFVTKSRTKLTINDGTQDYDFYAIDISVKYVASFDPQQPLYLAPDHVFDSGTGTITITSPYPIDPPIVVGTPPLYDQYARPVTPIPDTLELRIELNDLRSTPAGQAFDVEENARVIYGLAAPDS